MKETGNNPWCRASRFDVPEQHSADVIEIVVTDNSILFTKSVYVDCMIRDATEIELTLNT
jgi:hypothetical protein